jgi:hypothetical protein
VRDIDASGGGPGNEAGRNRGRLYRDALRRQLGMLGNPGLDSKQRRKGGDDIPEAARTALAPGRRSLANDGLNKVSASGLHVMMAADEGSARTRSMSAVLASSSTTTQPSTLEGGTDVGARGAERKVPCGHRPPLRPSGGG